MLTIEILRKLYAAKPHELPPLFVSANHLWPGKPHADTQGRIHCATRHLEAIAKQVPVMLVQRHPDEVIEFRFALERHHLEGGINDKGNPHTEKAPRIGGLRRTFGRNPRDGAASQ